MANRIVGNIIIVDSAMGNNFILTSANLIRNVNSYNIQGISFFSMGTTGTVILTQENTSLDVVFNANMLIVGILSSPNGFLIQNPYSVTFPFGLKTSELKVPTLTAGTAYIYLQ